MIKAKVFSQVAIFDPDYEKQFYNSKWFKSLDGSKE